MPDYTGNLASVTTADTSSTIANCIYPKLAIGGAPVPTTVIVNNQPLLMIAGNPYVCTPAPGFANDPGPCTALPRTVKAVVNTSVLIDEKFPVVSGDVVNSDRPLTGPYQHTRIVIGSNIN